MKVINNIACLKSVLFTFLLCSQANLSANEITKYLVEKTNSQLEEIPMPRMDVKKPSVKSIQIEIIKLTDNSGLTYLGGKVNAADLDIYLLQMKKILGDDFLHYRKYQSERDHQTFHMTLVNPYEYQALTKDIDINGTFSVSLLGLGRVSQDNKATYFVVAQSPEAASYRQTLMLAKKDFHVTLGFDPSDIYGVNKGVSSIIE